jgi:RNA polymerase sigma factor (sigma-70 family)
VAGDDAFAAFYRAEHDGQVRRAFLLVGSSEVANDVVHDAFLAVYRRWGDIDEPGPYLNRAVLNGCRDVGRRRSRDARVLPRLAAAADGGPAEAGDPLDDALGALPFNQRAAVVLRYYGQLTVAEIADALGCPRGSVGPWIHRALETLRRALS